MAQVPEHVRRAVVDDVRAGFLSQGEVARRHGVSRGSVSNWCRAASVESNPGTLGAALEAGSWDRQAWRERMAAKSAERMEWVLDRLVTGKGGREVQGYAMAAKVLAETVDLLMPAPSQHEGARGLLSELAREIGVGFGEGAGTPDPVTEGDTP